MDDPTTVLAWPVSYTCGCETIINVLLPDRDPSIGDVVKCDGHGSTIIVEIRNPREIVLGGSDG